MLQVKDPQEVFDELVKPMYEAVIKDLGDEAAQRLTELIYQSYVLGEIYGSVSTCLAQNIPIEKELWDNLAVKHMVRGDVDDVTVVDSPELQVVKAFSPILLP